MKYVHLLMIGFALLTLPDDSEAQFWGNVVECYDEWSRCTRATSAATGILWQSCPTK